VKDGQSAEEFMYEVEKKVNAMIGESTMNEYKSYKNLVKHKRRINRVFSEICGEKSFCFHCPGVPLKVQLLGHTLESPKKKILEERERRHR
jgi:hypothetical protein